MCRISASSMVCISAIHPADDSATTTANTDQCGSAADKTISTISSRRQSIFADSSTLASAKAILALEKYDADIANILQSSQDADASDVGENGHDSSNSPSAIMSVDRDDLCRISLLGQGQFCNVHLMSGSLQQQHDTTTASNTKRTLYAYKSIDPKRVRDAYEVKIAASDLAHEAKILSELDHKNVIKLRGLSSESFSQSYADGMVLGDGKSRWVLSCARTSNDNSNDSDSDSDSDNDNNRLEGYFLVIDTLTGTLIHRLNDWRNADKGNSWWTNIHRRVSSISRNTSCKQEMMYARTEAIIFGIAEGMRYLHSKDIVLRDLKPGNVGFDADGSIRLFDFGMARKVSDCDPTELCGSPRYMAPEAMNGGGYTLKVDVFSFGVLLFELCSLEVPFAKNYKWSNNKRSNSNSSSNSNNNSKSQKEALVEDFYKSVVENELRPSDNLKPIIPCPKIRALIEECWSTESNERPSFEEIIPILETIFQ